MNNQVKIEICKDTEIAAQKASQKIIHLVQKKPDAVIGLATGSTPEKTYEFLIHAYREGLSFKNILTFNLDEYLGLSADHPQSYRSFMQEKLFDHIDIRASDTRILDGLCKVPEVECQAFEDEIQACGGVDLWLLGIGQNGHIAFNEPGSTADCRTRKVALAESTIEANSDGRFFEDPKDVPRFALTAGIGTILEARKIVLLATGESKSQALFSALKQKPSADCPASFLQNHPDCTFVIDSKAALLLEI